MKEILFISGTVKEWCCFIDIKLYIITRSYQFMLIEILLAIVQATTEFLPVSSSGHLALISNLISEPDIFFITLLHIASLIAVLIFTRRELWKLISFEESYRKMWLYLILATIPAAIFGFIFRKLIEETFSSFLFLGIAFIFTGFILLLTKLTKTSSTFNIKKSLFIGLFQVLALFPGISRSGMTISAALFSGISREEATKFSFLLFIPLSIGAFVLELGEAYFNFSLLIAFILCLILSIIFLNFLYFLIKRGKFWLFSFYCFFIGLVSLVLYFL